MKKGPFKRFQERFPDFPFYVSCVGLAASLLALVYSLLHVL